jgi:hypothetical protein
MTIRRTRGAAAVPVEIGVGVAATATGESRRGSHTPDAGERERARGGSLVLFVSLAGACLPCPTVQYLWALAGYHYSLVPGDDHSKW